MCLCRSERTSFTNGNLKGSINAGRYTVDYLQCGNLPYLAWKNAHNCAGLSYRRIRRYLVWRLKRLEARDFSRVRIKFLIHNLWSVLFTTGYLTQTGRKDANTFMLTIPNMEIRNIFLTQIMEYFKKTVSENGEALEVRYCILQKEVQSNGSQINEKQIQKSSRTIEG